MTVLTTGYNLATLREPGLYTVKDPSDGPSSGDYLLEVTKGVVDTRFVARQVLTDLNTGVFFIRVYLKYVGWTSWTEFDAPVGTDLSIVNRTANGFDIASSTGDDVTIPVATTSLAGLMSADAVKLKPPADGFLELFCSPSGSDTTGDGSSGNPWRQPNHAWKVLCTQYDLQNAYVRVRLAAGEYEPIYAYGDVLNDPNDADYWHTYRPTPGTTVEFFGASWLTTFIKGNADLGSTTELDVTGISLTIAGITFDCNGQGGPSYFGYGSVAYSQVKTKNCGGSGLSFTQGTRFGGSATFEGDFSGGALVNVQRGAFATVINLDAILVTAVSASLGAYYVLDTGVCIVTTPTGSPSYTGKKYNVQSAGRLLTTLSDFPGTVAGTTASGGTVTFSI